jgi:hypothetical protein
MGGERNHDPAAPQALGPEQERERGTRKLTAPSSGGYLLMTRRRSPVPIPDPIHGTPNAEQAENKPVPAASLGLRVRGGAR